MPALKELAMTIVKSNDKDWPWLFVVPLYHFMAGLSFPYEPIPLDKEMKWRFWDELEVVRKKQQSDRLLIFYYSYRELMLMHAFCSLIIIQLYVHFDDCHGFNEIGLHVRKIDVVYVPSQGSCCCTSRS